MAEGMVKEVDGMALSMSKISACEVTDCSYNIDKQCHTMAITVGDGGCAMCDTYTKMGQKGGSTDIIGGVGACREGDCKFNQSLECNAGSIRVGLHSGHADCITYSRR